MSPGPKDEGLAMLEAAGGHRSFPPPTPACQVGSKREIRDRCCFAERMFGQTRTGRGWSVYPLGRLADVRELVGAAGADFKATGSLKTRTCVSILTMSPWDEQRERVFGRLSQRDRATRTRLLCWRAMLMSRDMTHGGTGT